MHVEVELFDRCYNLDDYRINLFIGGDIRAEWKKLMKTHALFDYSPKLFALKAKMVMKKTPFHKSKWRYSEQLVYSPYADINLYFPVPIRVHPGLSTCLYAAVEKKSPNISAISAIGETYAGWIAQNQYNARLLARPNHDFPDIVMESDKAIYLIEATASCGTICKPPHFEDKCLKLIKAMNICKEMDKKKEIVGLLVYSQITSPTKVLSYITEVHFV